MSYLIRLRSKQISLASQAFPSHNTTLETGVQLRALLQWPTELPLEEERARVLNEVGTVLVDHFGGEAANLVAAAKGKATALVELVTAHFPGAQNNLTHIFSSFFPIVYARAGSDPTP